LVEQDISKKVMALIGEKIDAINDKIKIAKRFTRKIEGLASLLFSIKAGKYFLQHLYYEINQ